MQELLLRLLDTHRVLSTSQLSRFTSAPQRTTEYRLSQLLRRRLVGRIRPARPTGSAPWHWWLTPAGAKLINGVACAAERRAPNPLFLAHTTAIADVLLALTAAGPAAGLAVAGWWPDAAGWAQWRQGSGPGPRLRRITPDATVHLRLTAPTTAPAGADADAGEESGGRDVQDAQQQSGGEDGCEVAAGQPKLTTRLGAALVEVDLATMTTERLRAKLYRYLDYAADNAWQTSQPSQPHAPLLLVLTTSDARASNFLAGAARTLPKPGEVWGPAYEAELRAAERLHVAACGHVRDPLVAVTGRVWRQPGDPNPVTLRELLAERIRLQKRAEQIRAHVRDWERRFAFENQLSQISRRPLPARMLPAEPRAAAVLRALHVDGREALNEWAGRHPEPARLLLARWYDVNAADRVSDAVDGDAERPQDLPMEPGLLAALAGEFESRWAEQARALLDTDGPIAVEAPKWRAAAHVLLTGQLNRSFDLQQAVLSCETPVAAQQRLWRAREPRKPDYPERADAAATDQWWALSLLGRRRTTVARLRAEYDTAHLQVCAGCGLSTDRRDLEAACRACSYPTTAASSTDTGLLLTVPEQVAALKAELR